MSTKYSDKAIKRIIEQYNELGETEQLKVLDQIKYHGILAAANEAKKTNTVYFGDLYSDVRDRQATFFTFEGMRTGLSYFDDATMGLRPGETITIAGPSNLGKTMVSLNIVANTVILNGAKALIVSMEMPAIDIASRMYNMIDEDRHDYLMENVIIQTELDVNTKHIAAMVERFKPDLVLLDHIQFLANQERGNTEYERTNIAIKKLQRITVEYNIPMIVISHVAKTRSGKEGRASAADLKGSSSIEQDTDIVLMLNRTEENRLKRELEVELVKHRKKEPKVKNHACLMQFNGVRLADKGYYRDLDAPASSVTKEYIEAYFK